MRKFLACCLLAGGVFCWICPAEEVKSAPETAVRERKPSGKADRDGRRRMFWRVFSRMTPEERRAMMDLQGRDPAAFQEEMKRRADELRKADEEKRQQIRELARRCRGGSAEEAAAAKEELTRLIREEYQNRLENSRRHLQEMRRRLAHLEEALKKRENGADAEVRDLVDKCIATGDLPAPKRPAKRRSPSVQPPPAEK